MTMKKEKGHGLFKQMSSNERFKPLQVHDSEGTTTDERYELALKVQQAEIENEEMIARQRVNTEITQEGG